MEEEKEKEEQKTEEEPKESAEVVEEAKAEVEEETKEVSEKEEVPVKEEAVEAEGEEMPAPVEEEEAKPLPREEKVEEEEIVEERIYTVPLGKCWIVPSNRRAPRAMWMIRSFVVKHMKLEKRGEKVEEEEEEPKRLVISNEVNERVWGRGVGKPPRKIRVRAAKDKEGNVTVYLAEGD